MSATYEGASVGIDLGTTYSCVGHFMNGSVTIFENSQGSKTTVRFIIFSFFDKILLTTIINHNIHLTSFTYTKTQKKNPTQKTQKLQRKRNAAFVRGFREERREIDRNGCQNSGISESGEHGI